MVSFWITHLFSSTVQGYCSNWYILLTSGFSLYLYTLLSCQAWTSQDVSNTLYIKMVSILLETTARPCRANVGVSQCLTGAALRSIFVSCPSSLATYTHYFITSNNFVVLVMIPAEKRSVCVAYMRKTSEGCSHLIWCSSVAFSLELFYRLYFYCTLRRMCIGSYKYISKCIAKVFLIWKFCQLKNYIFRIIELLKFVMFCKSKDDLVFVSYV